VIRKNVQLVDEGRETAARLSSQTMVSVKDEEVAELSGRLELISNRTNKTASDTRLELQRLESQNNALCSKFGADSACNRIRSLQVRQRKCNVSCEMLRAYAMRCSVYISVYVYVSASVCICACVYLCVSVLPFHAHIIVPSAGEKVYRCAECLSGD
jgi:hypothetical protein